MAKTYIYHPTGVCSRELHIHYENGIVVGLEAIGGCNGNLQGVGALIKGMKIEEAISRLSGIKCRGSRTGETSCPDQISKALKEIVELEK
ncbi:MAG: TIGR03905 family TSCPD domain-containing protein [Bacilli bacterium]|nr:TIGR03905 family TSCPD domain-containing protein [Bacilli bacterium]